MALIVCKECGREVSDKASVCPNCGCPISQGNVRNSMVCPKCGGNNVVVQQVQTGNIGAAQNKVYVQPAKKSKGCLYWCIIGWWLVPMKFIIWDWWAKLLFGGRNKSGLNFSANKILSKTVAICQNCGNSWNV